MSTSLPDRDRKPAPWLIAFGVTALAAGVMVSTALPSGNRGQAIAPVAGALGVALLFLAVTRFERFVALAIFGRASLDVAKLGSSSIDTTGAFALLFIGASTAWLLVQRRASAQAEPSATTPLIPPLAAFFAVSLLGVIFSEHPMSTLLEAVRFGTMIVLVATLGRLMRDERHLRLILGAVLASAVLPLLVGAMQLANGGAVFTADGLSRIRGTFLHSNPFGAYLALILTLAVAIFPHVRWRPRLALGALIFASGGMLVMTYTRGAWVAAAAGFVVVAILQDRRLLWLLLAGVIVVAVAVPSVGARLGDLSQEQRESGTSGNSLVWRLQYWGEVLSLQDNPTLGIGLKEVELSGDEQVPPHNDVVRVYVETGIMGLATYVWLILTLGVAARTALRRAAPGLPRGLAVAFAASLGAIVVFSLAANVITQLVILWYFMTIAAVAMCAARLAPAEQEPGSPGPAATQALTTR